MRYFIPLAVAGTVFAAPAAMAQEQAPFTGPHIEALVGYDSLSNGDDGVSDAVDGVGYGVGAGYDFQFGKAIVGIEGEVGDSSNKIRAASGLARAEIRTGRDLYVGARVGFAVAPSTLIYAKGGYTNQRIDAVFDNGAGTVTEDHADLEGFRVGAGVEQKFNVFGPGGFVKAEYRYSNYSNVNFPGTASAEIDTDRHQIMAGVGVRF